MSYRIRVPSKTTPLDEAHLLSGAERIILNLQEHRRTVVTGAVVLFVAAAAVGGVIWFDRQTAQSALELDHEATRHYLTRPSDQPEKADSNLKQALALYRQIVDQYPRTSIAPLALYHLGNGLVQANDIAGAIEAYKRFVLLYSSNPTLLGLVHQRLGYAYLLRGEPDQAAKAFTAALQLPGSLNKDHALFELGKLEEGQSRPEGALAHYQELIRTHPNSPFASEAAVRVKVLEVKKDSEGAIPSSEPTSQLQPNKTTATQSSPEPKSKKP
ncbi:MAG: tetratricopeptide repeat protein [Nitrospiraceae bacterium]